MWTAHKWLYGENRPQHHNKGSDKHPRLKHRRDLAFQPQRLGMGRCWGKWADRRQFNHGLAPENLEKWIWSQVGQPWNDVYSEVLRRFRPRHRHLVENHLDWLVDVAPTWLEDWSPLNYGWRHRHRFYVDPSGILLDSDPDAIPLRAKLLVRTKKLERILH